MDFNGEKNVTICGLLNAVRTIPTKKDPTKFLKSGVIEDLTGKIDFVAFNKTLEKCGSYIDTDQKVIMSGKFQNREDAAPQIIVDEVKPVSNMNMVTLNIKKSMNFDEIMSLKQVVTDSRDEDNKATDSLFFVVDTEEDREPVKIVADSKLWVNATNDFVQRLERQFGEKIAVSVESLD